MQHCRRPSSTSAEREAENTETVSAVGDGDPESETVGASCFKQLLGSETAARHGALYGSDNFSDSLIARRGTVCRLACS